MARTVSVAITANTAGFTAGMGKVSSSAKSAATTVKGSFASGLQGINQNQSGINKLSGALGKVGLVAAVGVGAAVKSFADFDAAMSGVAATGSDAKANLSALRDAAIQAGADTKFSATEAAQGVEALAKAGVSAKDTLGGGLSGALNLAAAGNLDVAGSAEAAASAMTQFGLSGAQVPHIADLLAAAAGKAQGEVSDMAQALGQVGQVAAQTGLSIEETTGTLAAFASAGLVGADAGTSFKTMLQSLTPRSKEAAVQMDAIGLHAYDAQGKFVGIAKVADQLRVGLQGLSQEQQAMALKTIFGSDAIRAASVLYKQGAAGIQSWITKTNQSGFAADVAKEKMNNLKGDLEQLKGSFDTALISVGSGANAPLRGVVQSVTGAVNSFTKLSQGSKSTILAIGGIGAAGLLGVAGVLRLATGISDATTAFGNLRTSSPRLAGALRGVGKAAGVAAAGLIGLQVLGAISRQIEGNFVPSIESVNGVLQQLAKNTPDALGNLDKQFQFSSGVLIKDKVNGVGDALKRLSENRFGDQVAEQFDRLTGTTDAPTTKIKAELSTLDAELAKLGTSGSGDQAAAAFGKIADQAGRAGVPVEQLAAQFPTYAAAVRDAAKASGTQVTSSQQLVDIMSGKLPQVFGQATGAVNDTAVAYGRVGAALDALGNKSSLGAADAEQLAKGLFASGDAAQNAVAAHSAYAEAIDKASAAIKANGDTSNKANTALADGTAKGRANIAVLNGLASSGKAYVQTLVAQGATAKQAQTATQGVRDEFVKAATAAGLSAGSARKLADSYGLIPKKVSTEFDAIGLALQQSKVEEFKAALDKLPAEQKARIQSVYDKRGAAAAKAELDKINGVVARPRILTKSDAAKVAHQADAFLHSVKDGKPAIKTKSDAGRVAGQARSFLNSIKNVDPKVLTRKDLTAAAAAKAFLAHIPNKNVTVHAAATGVGAAQSAINSIHGKSVNVTVNQVKGTTVKVRAEGGIVRGPGTATSDSIPAWLSDGEFVIRAAAVKAVGLDTLHSINAKGHATGGPVGPSPTGRIGFAAGGPVDLAAILKLIQALTDPLGDVAKLTKQAEAANKKVAKPKARYERAVKAYDTAVSHRDDERDRVNRLKREADATKGNTAADRELKKARHDLADANARVSRTSHEKTKATAAYNKVAGPSKDLTKQLTDAQNALADSARQAGEALAGPYRSASLDVNDILDSMKQGATDLTAFQAQIGKLRSLGLSETLVQQIVQQGAVRGGDVANQIIDGGKALADTLNQANANLTTAADALGLDSVSKPVRKAQGGLVSGRGTAISDSIQARLSNGEYVVNASAAAANRGVLDAINFGRTIVDHRFIPSHGYGHYIPQTPTVARELPRGGDVHISGNYIVDLDLLARKQRNGLRDSMSMAALSTRSL